MQENQNIQKSILFDNSISHINTTSNDSNIIYKKIVASSLCNFVKTYKDDNKKTLKN